LFQVSGLKFQVRAQNPQTIEFMCFFGSVQKFGRESLWDSKIFAQRAQRSLRIFSVLALKILKRIVFWVWGSHRGHWEFLRVLRWRCANLLLSASFFLSPMQGWANTRCMIGKAV